MFLPLGDNVDNRAFPVAGVVLITLNVLAFVHTTRVTATASTADEVLEFYTDWGLVPADLAAGQCMGVVTHIFMHAGIFHLVGNMIVLWAFINTLESALGTLCTLGYFVTWGVTGGVIHTLVHWGGDVPLVGASGAVAGLIGAYCVAFGPMTNIKTLVWVVWPMKVDVPASLFAGVWVLMQIFGFAESAESAAGVAWDAHLGGFAAGCLVMLCVRNHTSTQLVAKLDGGLTFQSEGTDIQPVDQDAPLEFAPLPESCPDCDATMGEEQRLADNLVRCGNPECQRLVYIEAVNLPPTSRTRK